MLHQGVLGCEQEEVKGVVTQLQGQTGLQTAVSTWDTPELVVEPDSMGSWRQHVRCGSVLQALCFGRPCHGNCLVVQGKEKKKTVKTLLSLMQTLKPHDNFSAAVPHLSACVLMFTCACTHTVSLTWNAHQRGHTAFPCHLLHLHLCTASARASPTGSPGPIASCMIAILVS